MRYFIRGPSVDKVSWINLAGAASNRAFYGATNGLTIDGGGSRYVSMRPAAWMKILPLAEVMPYVEGMRRYGIPQVWGYLPFTDCNDSNPYCAATVCAAAGRCGTASSTFFMTTSPG
jgi:hypothetical protein